MTTSLSTKSPTITTNTTLGSTNGINIRTAEVYKREMMGFGIEVLKYPRTGKP